MTATCHYRTFPLVSLTRAARRNMTTGINIPHDDQLIDEKTAAKIMGLSPRFFQSRRLEGAGPPFIRLSQRCIRYRWRDLKTWFETFQRPGGGIPENSQSTSAVGAGVRDA
jgi:hypothetical protein